MLLVAGAPPLVVGLILGRLDVYEGAVRTIYWIVAWVWLGYWAVRILLTWYRYNNDIWIITNQRIVDSIKNTPIHHRLSTADLVNIQDMTVQRNGLLQTVFDFGDIVCQTAAEQPDFRLGGIPHPREVQALVDRERDRERLRTG
jgi:hypothetical protein